MDNQIGYAQSGTNKPLETRIVIEELPGGTRYTDPPGSRSVAYYRVLATVSGSVSVGLMVAIPMFSASRTDLLKQSVGIAVVALIFAMLTKRFIECARRFAARPVIVEAGRLGLGLNHPDAGTYFWTPEQVSSIRYSSWLSIPGVAPDGFGGLLIRAGGKQFQILHGRPIPEITWLVKRLYHGLGVESNEQTGKQP